MVMQIVDAIVAWEFQRKLLQKQLRNAAVSRGLMVKNKIM